MKQRVKVGIFLVIFVAVAIIIAIFALSNSDTVTPMEEYEENIRVLNDTIKTLKKDIAEYEREIERIDIEREKLKRKIEQIIADNERVDTELANGDWDSNIKFLSDFLSEKDNFGE